MERTTEKPMRVAAYYRVSSEKQRDRDTIAAQRTAANRLVHDRGWKLVREFEDDGHSARAGKLHKRLGFASLLDGARAREFEAVIVAAFDRLTRAEDLTEMGQILGTLQSAGVLVVTAGGEETDLGTFGGRISALVRGQLAAEESRVKSDRTTRGRARVAAEGRPPGRAPWGYRFDREAGRWTVVEPAASLVREMYARVAAGESTEKIAADMHRRGEPGPRQGRWLRTRVYDLVVRECYRGPWRANGAQTIDLPPLVDGVTWNAAHAALVAARRRGLRRTRFVYLLESLAACALCGAPIRVHTSTDSTGRPVRSYVCARRQASRRLDGDRCELPLRRVAAVDAAVWARIAEALARPELLAEAFAEAGGDASAEGTRWRADLDGWEQRKAQLSAAEGAILRRFTRGLITEPGLDHELRIIKRESDALDAKIAAARDRADGAGFRVDTLRKAEARLAELRLTAAEGILDAEARREVVRLLCSPGSVVVAPDRVEVGVVMPASGMGKGMGCPTHYEELSPTVRLRVVV